MNKKNVSIIVLHYKGLDLTLECLGSLAKSTSAHNVSVYLVVVGKNQLTIPAELHNQLALTQLCEPENKGYAGGNNTGIRQALKDGADAIILLNNDTVVDSGFIDPLVLEALTPQIGLVSPLIYFYPGNEFHNDDYLESERGKVIWYAGGEIDWDNMDTHHWGVDEVDHGQFNEKRKTDFATGCCMAFSKETIASIGLMNENFFLYYEDVEWSLASYSNNLNCIVNPHSHIWHKNAGSTGGSGSTLQTYYQHRNRIAFGLRYAPFRTKIALVKHYLTSYQSLSATTKKAVWDGLLSCLGKRDFR